MTCTQIASLVFRGVLKCRRRTARDFFDLFRPWIFVMMIPNDGWSDRSVSKIQWSRWRHAELLKEAQKQQQQRFWTFRTGDLETWDLLTTRNFLHLLNWGPSKLRTFKTGDHWNWGPSKLGIVKLGTYQNYQALLSKLTATQSLCTVSAGSFFTYAAYVLPIHWQIHIVMNQIVTFVLA